MTPVTLHTPRLVMRPWREADTEPFVTMNADPRVCEFYPTEGYSRAESLAMIRRIREEMERYGFGLWALELLESGDFIGYTGLKHLRANHPLAPNVEVSWRLKAEVWGQGYATEAAKMALQYGFSTAALREIVAFTAASNARSIAVMQRLGLQPDASRNFLHPDVPANSPLRPHVTYVARREHYT